MENTRTNQKQQLSKENQLTDRDQQDPASPLNPERNSIILEDWFSGIVWTGKLAAVLLFNLLTSESERHRDIGLHILKNLYEEVEETTGLTTSEDLFAREVLFLIAAKQMKKG